MPVNLHAIYVQAPIEVFMTPRYRMLIGSELVPAVEGLWQSIINPSTEEIIAEAPQANAVDVDLAVQAAQRAFPAWSTLSPGERSHYLWQLAVGLEKYSDELIQLESTNAGKPIKLVRNGDVPFAIDNLKYFAGQARVIEGLGTGEVVGGYTSTIRREPIGVIGSITPWNYPLMMAVWKLAPALAAGNTVVIKPAPQTPLTSLKLGEIAQEIGLPPGVLNIVTGGTEVGEPLVIHPQVRMISFTGSTTTGKRIMGLAAHKMARVHLELGGKAPLIVLADADIEAAARGAIVGSYVNTGQDCTAVTRILVERQQYHHFLDRFTELSKQVRIGEISSEATDMGPLISASQKERVAGFVSRAQAAGIKCHWQGEVPTVPGFYYPPTIFVEAPTDSEIMQEEVFGPVVIINPVDSVDEAITVANDVRYGLAASVWTKNIHQAWKVAAALQFGTVWVNDHLPLCSEMPHGGFKESGFGKDLSRYAFEEYTIAKHVMFDLTGDAEKGWHFSVFGDPQ
ncbi:aminobutyraldehyde dehydrogenase [Synechococcus sp. PCC 6312]|uniref:aminobutyraldehyde dehydrogenase n=1 Tax=Synechococcus sp. (strain ATCC 27167 / PCC 6312) TaxID=195253 RepID=UPI00029F0077|nr:aminobutyraldehyde dehydrogenase [Synechococcus sp. PCC 6312]AFY60179.1 NAD-dependent aldehyde dehydrogenase [Synechococcus sp. PCC 6312]